MPLFDCGIFQTQRNYRKIEVEADFGVEVVIEDGSLPFQNTRYSRTSFGSNGVGFDRTHSWIISSDNQLAAV